MAIAQQSIIQRTDGGYSYPSSRPGHAPHHVTQDQETGGWRCDCECFTYRHTECRHIRGCRRKAVGLTAEPDPMPWEHKRKDGSIPWGEKPYRHLAMCERCGVQAVTVVPGHGFCNACFKAQTPDLVAEAVATCLRYANDTGDKAHNLLHMFDLTPLQHREAKARLDELA